MTAPTFTPPTLYPEHELLKHLRLSRTTWWRLRRGGTAPACVMIGERRFYRPEVVEAWLADRGQRAA